MTNGERGLRMWDNVAHEAFGALQGFADNNPACPQYLRDMVREYRARVEEAKAICDGRIP
jgi:hypothetical protein